jgi:hypothetical protein
MNDEDWVMGGIRGRVFRRLSERWNEQEATDDALAALREDAEVILAEEVRRQRYDGPTLSVSCEPYPDHGNKTTVAVFVDKVR